MQTTPIRIEDEDVSIALRPEEFDCRLKELLPPEDATAASQICSRIIYWRGEIPKKETISYALLWWVLGMLFLAVFLYGAYSLIHNAIIYFIQ